MSRIIGFKSVFIGGAIVASTALAGLGFAAAANAAPSTPTPSTVTVVKGSSATLEAVPGVKIDLSKVKPGKATAVPGAVIPEGSIDGSAVTGTTPSAK
jgi:hypothetical protein